MSSDRQTPGGLGAAFFKLVAKSAAVREVRALGGDAFRLITLEGGELRGVRWAPGSKVQIHVGGWAQRTYTPLSWDSAHGSLQLLAYLHGAGPGTQRMRALAPGEACTVFGPRGSIDLGALERPAVIFGDETSIGLAHALRYTQGGASAASIVLEVTSRAEVEPVLEALDLAGATLFERAPGDAHLEAVAAAVAERVGKGARSIALSGKAQSIQAVNKAVRAAGLSSRQIRTKAYWAPGKAGLD